MLNLQSPISQLPKITKPQVAAFKKLGLITIHNLLWHLPFRYLDFSKTADIKDLKPGENVSLKVKIKTISSRFSFRSHLSLAEAVVSDSTGSLKVVWFNQAYLAKSLKAGEEIFLAGQAEYYNFALQMSNPIYEKASDFPVHTSRLVPVYHLTKNLYPRTLRNAIKEVLPLANELEDILPESVQQNLNLISQQDAIKLSHFPEKLDDVQNAQKRFNFQELFISQLLVQKQKLANEKKGAYPIKFQQELVKSFVNSLPFQLTGEQKKAAWEILQDMEKPVPMNRLLEGDVGSGKTLVALIAALEAINQGFQVAFLAPTEILASQHFETGCKFLKIAPQSTPPQKEENYKLEINLLTNTYSESGSSITTKAKLRQSINAGAPGLYIGTHALLQKNIKFKKLSLVIIDEQHRFGVNQRSHLIKSSVKIPHLISLSATPIPRTLKLALSGELDISQIKTKPLGRKAIITKLVSDIGRIKAYKFIAQEIKAGRQAFVITPLIEESASDAKSAKLEAANLAKIFPELKIGLLHGKMPGKEKEAAMADFLQNKTQILVSTSVVEVGVDVPNASVMVIEGAEHFGLSQLHQFRGRVGRSDFQSYCFLFVSPSPKNVAPYFSPPLGEVSHPVPQKELSENTKPTRELETDDTTKRLLAFTKTQDGFELAELDLKQRGFGKLFGQEQSGWDAKFFDPNYISLIPSAREAAKNILVDDITLSKYPLLQAKLQDQIVHFE